MSGKEAMMSTPGPMTTDRESLEIIMKAALASEPWRLDPSVTFKPWTPEKTSLPSTSGAQTFSINFKTGSAKKGPRPSSPLSLTHTAVPSSSFYIG